MSTATEQDVLNDLLTVKDKIVTSWDDILANQNALKNDILQGIAWFKSNQATITSEIEAFSLPDLTEEQIAKALKNFKVQVEGKTHTYLDDVLAKLPNLRDAPVIDDAFDIITTAESWITKKAGIAQEDLDIVVSILKLVTNSGFSIRIKPLHPDAHSASHSGKPSPSSEDFLTLLLEGLGGLVGTTWNDDLKSLTEDYHTLMTNISVPDFSTQFESIYNGLLQEATVTAEDVFDNLTTLLTKDLKDAAKTMASETNATLLAQCIQSTFNLLEKICSAQLPGSHDLALFLNELDGIDLPNPTLLDALTLVMAIPVSVIYEGDIPNLGPPQSSGQESPNALDQTLLAGTNTTTPKKVLGWIKIVKGILELPLQTLILDGATITPPPKSSGEASAARKIGMVFTGLSFIEVILGPVLTYPNYSKDHNPGPTNYNTWITWSAVTGAAIPSLLSAYYSMKKPFCDEVPDFHSVLKALEVQVFTELCVLGTLIGAEINPKGGAPSPSAEEGAIAGSLGRLCAYMGNIINAKYKFYNETVKYPAHFTDGGLFPESDSIKKLMSFTLPTEHNDPTGTPGECMRIAHALASCLKITNGILMSQNT